MSARDDDDHASLLRSHPATGAGSSSPSPRRGRSAATNTPTSRRRARPPSTPPPGAAGRARPPAEPRPPYLHPRIRASKPAAAAAASAARSLRGRRAAVLDIVAAAEGQGRGGARGWGAAAHRLPPRARHRHLRRCVQPCGTPNEGAAWLHLQRLADTWHRILLIPVTGGVVVGMMHGLLEIFDQMKFVKPPQKQGINFLAAIFPTVNAVQAAVTLGTGCSLGPEGPSVDIGKSCANGCSEMMENNRERRIALVAAGAAAGIASGFNAAVAGCFFAIETVLRPLKAENSPPFTTAMIILASVISSTVTNVLLGERPAFIVPAYELKSAAELPLYLILGMLCGAVSVVFGRLVVWFSRFFGYLKERYNFPIVVYPALGGLGAGLIALKHPGILYWGFTNVEEILHTGKSASAPGIWLLACSCKGSCNCPLQGIWPCRWAICTESDDWGCCWSCFWRVRCIFNKFSYTW